VDRIMVAAAIGVALVFAAGVILGFLVTISLGSPAASAVRVDRRVRPDRPRRKPWRPAYDGNADPGGENTLEEIALPRDRRHAAS
jgi:hypothetical protein